MLDYTISPLRQSPYIKWDQITLFLHSDGNGSSLFFQEVYWSDGMSYLTLKSTKPISRRNVVFQERIVKREADEIHLLY